MFFLRSLINQQNEPLIAESYDGSVGVTLAVMIREFGETTTKLITMRKSLDKAVILITTTCLTSLQIFPENTKSDFKIITRDVY